MFFKLISMAIVYSLFTSSGSYSSKYYTDEEISSAEVQGQSALTLKEHQLNGQTKWFSYTLENYTYKIDKYNINTYHKYAMVKMAHCASDDNWYGDIAIFPLTSDDDWWKEDVMDKNTGETLKKIDRSDQQFHAAFGTPFDSIINFKYVPSNVKNKDLKAYVILEKSETGSKQAGKGYNQFTRKCFIEFVKKHIDAELIFSDGRNDISKHILSKPEFGFQECKNNEALSPYIKEMRCPYYLSIDRGQ